LKRMFPPFECFPKNQRLAREFKKALQRGVGGPTFSGNVLKCSKKRRGWRT